MRHIDAFLSRIAQETRPKALVTYTIVDGKRADYQLGTGDKQQPTGLGSTFKEARNALRSLAKAEATR